MFCVPIGQDIIPGRDTNVVIPLIKKTMKNKPSLSLLLPSD